MTLLTVAMIKTIAPSSNEALIYDVVEEMNSNLPSYSINTWLRVTHFIAQAAHESAGFRVMEEYATGAAYEGRKDLGNTQKGDGVRYKGRGIFQLTGRWNYDYFGKKLGVDLVNNPELAETPRIAVLTACEFWKGRGISQFADANDIIGVTKRINPGLMGLQDRRNYLAKAQAVIPKTIFTSTDSSVQKTDINSVVLAKIGDKSETVSRIQKLLYDIGYDINVDGIFGPRTEIIIRDFQKRNGLLSNGIVDSDTMERLQNA
jgi:putative chitinase